MSHQAFPKSTGTTTDGYVLVYSATDGYIKPTQLATPRYYGYTTGSQLWSSATWADITGVTTITDGPNTFGISRTNSTFTVTKAGTYIFYVSMNFYGNGSYTGVRLRDTTNNITLVQRSVYGVNGVTQPGIMHSVVKLQTSTNYNIQYVIQGASAQWNASDPIDGETMRTGEITIYYIGA